MHSLIKWVLLSFVLASTTVQAQINSDDDLHIETLAKGLSVPWGMAVLPDNSLLISQRNGNLTRLDLTSGELTDITGVPPVRAEGQGGLFDVALPPDCSQTGWIYFSYSKDVDGQGATTLARAKLTGNTLNNWQDLLVTKSRTRNTVHFGGRITFDGHGHVFISVGERGVRPNAQDRSTHAGSILRLNMDGSVPADNPFLGNKDVLPEIWSYGHRNPQGLFFNRQSGTLWEVEHGPRGGDEINLILPGHNYGWPVISYGMEYWGPIPVGKGTEQEGMEQPVKYYIPSIATSSLIQYQGTLFKGWHNNLLVGALNLQHLNRIELDENNQAVGEQRLLQSLNSRIRNVVEGPSGELYIATDNGYIYRVTPARDNR